ncbi:hypothetical protein LSUE1_G003365 [Lachnellula suecica]|uniref:Uncharacterized protein n=1 Tax=Lachnellula suecica TaxID=602035 RepID=A0A8T9C7T2_9HELO|nr:hypothetical protein LSUE1_G003365 [Lachnellula suecica]
MVVFILASAAELTEDFAAVENHIRGLEKIVKLRGGVRALNTHNNMQVKVCRADLSYALVSGQRPLLFKEDISWDVFIADRDLVQCNHQPHSSGLHIFLSNSADTRLHNAFRDLHSFSCISNLAYQTTRKLSPEIYNDIMISILYRLTNLSFESDIIQEALRIGLLVVSSTIFMQRLFMDHPYGHLLNLYRNALFNLHNATSIALPVPVSLWMPMLFYVVAPEEAPSMNWLNTWVENIISSAGISSWTQAHEILKTIVWVDFVHDRLGEPAFEAAKLRLGTANKIEALL